MGKTYLVQELQRLTRREFLKGSLLLGGAMLTPRLFRPVPVSAAGSPRIAIVGAGLAGLTAAYRLRQAGLTATVYEAGERVGGRCWTRRGEFADGQITEHGGELIDTGHRALRQLIQELRLSTESLLRAEKNGTEPLYYFDGAPYTYRAATNDMKAIWQKLHRDLVAAGYPTLYNRYTERGRQLDEMSILDWIAESVPGGTGSRLGKLLDVAYNIEFGAECSDQSALNLLYLLGYHGQGQMHLFGPSDEKYRVKGGNDQVVARLAAAVEGQVQLGAALTALVRNPDGTYTLHFGRNRQVVADKVILTVPFSVLRHAVDLSQAGFSPLKRTAIAEMGMGSNSKLHVQFAERHWESLGQNGETYADTGYQCTWDVSRAQPGGSGILVNYTGGRTADGFRSGTAPRHARRFLQQIEPVMPGLTEHWNGRATLDHWAGNALTRGSYSYWRVGQYTRFAGVEAEREGNCHFAGEHTSIDFQGYLNGAVESGERAASEILAEVQRKQR